MTAEQILHRSTHRENYTDRAAFKELLENLPNKTGGGENRNQAKAVTHPATTKLADTSFSAIEAGGLRMLGGHPAQTTKPALLDAGFVVSAQVISRYSLPHVPVTHVDRIRLFDTCAFAIFRVDVELVLLSSLQDDPTVQGRSTTKQQYANPLAALSRHTAPR